MLVHYLDAEVMMQSTRNSYVAANGIVVLPTVSTELYENNSSTTINGYVLEDGGADVSSRGIAWATTYNPTIDNDSKDIGAGIGDFSFEITGLTEGTTYFARAFATNSKGTKYGNCITFEAGSSLGIDDNEINKLDFTIYPNPAFESVTFSFYAKSSENFKVAIFDTSGKIVLSKNLGVVQEGEQNVKLDLSKMPSGTYICHFTNNSGLTIKKKLLISN